MGYIFLLCHEKRIVRKVANGIYSVALRKMVRGEWIPISSGCPMALTLTIGIQAILVCGQHISVGGKH